MIQRTPPPPIKGNWKRALVKRQFFHVLLLHKPLDILKSRDFQLAFSIFWYKRTTPPHPLRKAVCLQKACPKRVPAHFAGPASVRPRKAAPSHKPAGPARRPSTSRKRRPRCPGAAARRPKPGPRAPRYLSAGRRTWRGPGSGREGGARRLPRGGPGHLRSATGPDFPGPQRPPR